MHGLSDGVGVVDRTSVEGIASQDIPDCIDVRTPLPWLKNQYETLALISHQSHLDRFDASDESTLLVSSDWLLWQRCIRERRHCVHWDLGLLDWDARGEALDHSLSCNDWVYIDGVDVTQFRGVSLGRKLVRPITIAVTEHAKLSRALLSHLKRFRPSRIVYFGYHTDFDFLGETEGIRLTEEIGRSLGIDVINRTGSNYFPRDDVGTTIEYHGAGERRITMRDRAKLLAVRTFGAALAAMSLAIGWLGRNRARAMLVLSTLTSKRLLEDYRKTDVRPIFLARWVPNKKNLWAVLGQLRRGVLLADVPAPDLTSAEAEEIVGMERRLLAAWDPEATGAEGMVHRIVRERIFVQGRLREVARDVKWAEGLLARYRPQVLLTDGLQNRLSAILVELCRPLNIKTAVTWHGPYFQDIKFDILGCDPRTSLAADYCFSWGKLTDEWLAKISAKTASLRTGSLIGPPKYRAHKIRPWKKGGKALVLQYLMGYHDLCSPLAHEYFFFVQCVRALRNAGISEIRFRLHPGGGKASYYRQIAEEYDLNCEIRGDGPFGEHVDWADFVVGPVASGGMLEVMAAGRPCFPVLFPPHSMTMTYFAEKTLFEDMESLSAAVESGSPVDPVPYLRDFSGIGEEEDPARKVWRTLSHIADGSIRQLAEKT